MKNHLISLQRLARLSNNDSDELDDDFIQFLVDELDQPTSPVGRLAPLLLQRLQQLDQQPAELLRRLQFASPLVQQLHQLQQQWLGKAVQALLAENIAVIPLQAAAFNDRLYPQDTPRIGANLDLLIREQDIDRACQCIDGLLTPVNLTTSRREADAKPCKNGWKLPQQIPGRLYLHHTITPAENFPQFTQQLFERSLPYTDSPGALIRKLSVEDHLLYLAIQGTCDLSVINHSLLDAHEIWSQLQPDHYKLIKTARQTGASNALFILLDTCRRRLNTPVPERWLERLPQSHLRASIGTRFFEKGALYNREELKTGHKIRQLLGYALVPDKPGKITTAARNYLIPVQADS
ncbi:MAG: nucleotidyltransferase family protein [Pseudomonadota bacterium]|nr:nucleotidyltransferase family protein [Pseudomonadota bacterium]